jgi:hypothetical protein
VKSRRTPAFLENLYRDMRDRRLLFPALALLVALIAVPVLLKSSPAASPSPPLASTGAGNQGAAQAAVLAQRTGVTNYRKRLDWLRSKDPFRSRVPAAKAGATRGASSTATTSTSTALGGGSATVTGTASSSSSLGSAGSSSSSTSSASPSGSGGGSSPPSSARRTPKPSWYSFRVSVAVGPAGDLTERKHVRRLVFLPGENRPMVALIGVSEDAKRAIFVVSDEVSSVRGDGRCVPRRGSCEFLELKPGDKASLRYQPEGDRTYNLKLKQIELVAVDKPQASGPGKRGPRPLLGPDG